MSLMIFAELAVVTPTSIAITVFAAVAIYLAFKIGKFVLKMLLLLAVLVAILLIAWWHLVPHQGAP